MSLGFDFHPEARAEFFAEVDWYDAREAGLGTRFEGAVRSAIDDACDSPEAWPAWSDWGRKPLIRSKGVNEFPYRLVYYVPGDKLVVVALAHSKRRPGYWRARISE